VIRLFGRTYAPDDLGTCLVTVDEGRVTAVEPMSACPPDAWGSDGSIITPGFIDLQINGAFGHDFSDPAADVAAVASALPSTGVTAFLPTVISSLPERYPPCLRGLAQPVPNHAARVLGLHLEGPFLDPAHAGTHERSALRTPDVQEAMGWLEHGDVRLVTLAPELPGALDCIRALDGRGVLVAAGHSGATWQEAERAMDAGLRMGTHLFNAMRPMHHRDPGLAGWLLAAPVPVSLICDGAHVALGTLRWVAAAKGPDQLVIVTDGLAALGMPPGRYRLAGQEIVSDGTVARRADGTLSGSALPMDRVLGGLVASGFDPSLAVRAVTATPARVLGQGSVLGSIVVGRPADLVLLDATWRVLTTLIDGQVAFAAAAAGAAVLART
jgi:N-acetylglucosamine-6-phosphate deacetylase